MNYLLFAFLLTPLLFFGITDSFAESETFEPELKPSINERHMAADLSHYLIGNKVNWKLSDEKLPVHTDIGRTAPWTMCTELVHPDEQTFYLSITNLDDHSMSDVTYHQSLPSDCAFFVYPPKIITNPDKFIVEGDKPYDWLRSCWTFDYVQDFFTDENPYQYTSLQHRDYVMCKTAIDLNLYETDLEKLGKNLDWNNYAEEITSEYLNNWSFGEYDAFPETLHYQIFVDSRDSFPPKMHAKVTFGYSEDGKLKTFDSRFVINPLYSPALFLEWQNEPTIVFADSDSGVELITHKKIKWLDTNYPSTGTAVIQVVSPNMNLDPKAIDNFDVDVWSDTDLAGIDLTVSETGDATGIFESTVFFTITDDTSGHRLRVSHGDTFYSKFDGNTLYESLDVDKNDLISTASINGESVSIDDRVHLDKKSYAWNDKAIITINAPEENFDANSIDVIDSSKDSIKMYTRHFGIDDYVLVETGINSGMFFGEIILVNEFDDVDSDGITVSFEYEEDKTAIGSAPIVLNPEPKNIIDERCGADTTSIDGVCQVVKVDTVSDDASPFFEFFVYFDDLISWIFEK
ncbi:hypothetical protein K0U27_04070 [archaeon]|nr:hypothetical protein [archaeon]